MNARANRREFITLLGGAVCFCFVLSVPLLLWTPLSISGGADGSPPAGPSL
jgi:hypothetical protein